MASWQEVAKKEGLGTSGAVTRVGTEKGRATAAPQASSWQDVAAAEGLSPEKSLGTRTGEALREAPRKFFQAAKDIVRGTVETPLALANNAISGTVATVAGPIVQALGGDGMVARRYIQDNFTYTPGSESGKASVQAVADVGAATIGKAGNFAADAAQGMGADELTVETTRDVGNMLAGVGLAKAAAPTVRAVQSASKAVADTTKGAGRAVKNAGRVVSEIYTPERQMVAAGGHAMAGDFAGATLQAGMSAARTAYRNAKNKPAAAVASPSTVAEALSPIQGITTKAEATALRDVIAQRRAETAARNAASGRNVRSTVGDTVESQRATEAAARPVAAPVTVAEAIAMPARNTRPMASVKKAITENVDEAPVATPKRQPKVLDIKSGRTTFSTFDEPAPQAKSYAQWRDKYYQGGSDGLIELDAGAKAAAGANWSKWSPKLKSEHSKFSRR